ncbi:unnamed protein product, partial [Symbiodinium sp. KB8]
VSSPVTQWPASFSGTAHDTVLHRLDLGALTHLTSGAMSKRSLDAGEAGPTSRPRLLPPPLASTVYEEASSEPEEDPVGEPGPVIPSAVAKTSAPPPPPPPMPPSSDSSTVDASLAKATPIPATVGPRPRSHMAHLRSGPPAPSPATPAADFLSPPGASEGVHIFVPGPRGVSCLVPVTAPVLLTPPILNVSTCLLWMNRADGSTLRPEKIVFGVLRWVKSLGRRPRCQLEVTPQRRVQLLSLGVLSRPDVALALRHVFRGAPGVVVPRLSLAHTDRHQRHLLQALKVCLLCRAAPTMLRSRSPTPALYSLIFRFAWFGSRVVMLHPRLPWLCDWELCRFPALMLSSEGCLTPPCLVSHGRLLSGTVDVPALCQMSENPSATMDQSQAALLAEIFHGWQEAAQSVAEADDVVPGAVPGSLAATRAATAAADPRLLSSFCILDWCAALAYCPASSSAFSSDVFKLSTSLCSNSSIDVPSPLQLLPDTCDSILPDVHPSTMGKAQRQRRQSSRPGQLNRALSRSDETRDPSSTTSPTAVPEVPEELDHASHALTPREKALFGYVTWSTSQPPPMTVFVRPYLQALTDSASKRSEKHAAGGDATMVDTVPSPSTPPLDAADLARRWTLVDDHLFLVVVERRLEQRLVWQPDPIDVEVDATVAPAATRTAAEMKLQSKKPTATTKTQELASSTTKKGGPATQSRLRKFRAPHFAVKYAAAKPKLAELPSSQSGDQQPGN